MNRHFQFKLSYSCTALALLISVLVVRAYKVMPVMAQMETNSPSQAEQLKPDSASEISENTTDQNIVDVAVKNPKFSTFLKAIKASGLETSLVNDGPFTVFAPTDTAFEELPTGAVEMLLEPKNQNLLRTVLSYHIIAGEMNFDQLQTGGVDSFGGSVAVQVSSDGVVVNDANVVESDITASNGVIHAINKVLLPSEIRSQIMAQLQASQ